MSEQPVAEDLGRRLRQARERRGVTLRQIANATKIPVTALEALERNDISKLPAGIFGRAFVRAYAAEVGLDPEQALAEFLAQFARDPSVSAGPVGSGEFEDREAHESGQRMAFTFLRLVLLSVPLVGLVLYFGATGGRRSQAPPALVAPPVPVATPSPSTGARAPVEVPVESPPDADAVQVARAAPDPATPDRPTTAVSPAGPGRVAVTLLAVRPCWISAVADGQQVIQRLLDADERETVEAQRELVLTVGDASALMLTVNGRPARVLGPSGKVVTLRMTPANFTDYLAAP